MRRFYNVKYGVIFYPETYIEAVKCLAASWLLGGFRRTWRGNSNWKTKPVVLGCVECELETTEYPDECGA